MPSNTRGKIKEQLEGIHRNTEAIKAHIAKAMVLIGDKNATLTSTFKALNEVNNLLDESAQNTYGAI